MLADAQYIDITCELNYVHDLDGPVGLAKTGDFTIHPGRTISDFGLADA